MERKSTPSKYEKQSRERIYEVIVEFCNGSQQELSNRTGVGKASISQYVNGKNIPSNITAKKICIPFGLNPAWIMGFDVPKHLTSDTSESSSSSEPALTQGEKVLIDKYRELNDAGQEKLLADADDMTQIPKYKKAEERIAATPTDITPAQAGIIKKSEGTA
ncbi:MAG: helix-turn-helix transcriptional regulator [Lachnospiraceae bacterium]|nr:helix-turn-helix transcriptional regulator [Lachnospiraceae bacterium]